MLAPRSGDAKIALLHDHNQKGQENVPSCRSDLLVVAMFCASLLLPAFAYDVASAALKFFLGRAQGLLRREQGLYRYHRESPVAAERATCSSPNRC